MCVGQGEDFAVDPVDPLGDVAGHLDVLHLVSPDGNEVAVVEQNVGRHQHGIVEEPGVGGQAFRLFILVGVTLFQKVHRCHSHEEPRELGDLRHVRLAEEGRPLRIEAQGEIRQCHLAGVVLQYLRVVDRREGVQIGNEVKRLLVILQVDVLTDGTEVVAPMRHTCWLDS